MRSATAQILRRFRSEQSGQSLIIVTLAMVVVLGVAAMAIDVAGWYQKHHQAQVVADAAALAAANCLANPNTGTASANSGPVCTSSTDKSDAEAVALQYAANNGIPESDLTVDVNTSTDTVQVTANTTAPAFFANMFGIKTASQTAGSTASWSGGASDSCTGNASSCAAVYAGNTGCDGSASNPVGVWFGGSAGATVNVTGSVHSQGQLGFSSAGATFTASSTTVTTNCYSASNLPWQYYSGNVVASLSASEPWPVNYAASPYFTACTTNCTTVNGIANVPPYCTEATTSSSGYTFISSSQPPYSGNVYCAIGPSGTPSNPATWDGPITISENVGMNSSNACSNQPDVTLIGGSVTFYDSASCLAPDLYNCLAYATSGNIELSDGTYDWSGTLFAPNGTIDVGLAGAGTPPWVADSFLEAQNVQFQNTNFTLTGSGPSSSSSSSSSGGTDSLTQ